MYTREDILKMVEEEDVEFIRLQYTDMFGTLKNMAITVTGLARAMDGKCTVDGSSIEGLSKVEESDMYLIPDLDTFAIMPWRPSSGKVARFICDVLHTDGKTPCQSNPRHILREALEEAEAMGYHFVTGPECEFFLFETDENGQPTIVTHEHAGYFDVGPLDQGENARREIILTMEEMGYQIVNSHHEIAPAQHEIDLLYGEAMEAADAVVTFKLAAKTIAKNHGLYCTFMPKPTAEAEGSSMHVHMSLQDENGKNVFYDAGDENGLSKTAYYFIGGLMKHAKALTAITNPLVNSYKRLVPGYDAPAYIAWSRYNRSPLIRIPLSPKENTRVELRSPDPAANPYLAFAACLTAGLDGIRNHIMPPAAVEGNLYAMTEEELQAAGIEKLPANLGEALDELEKDPVILNALGRDLAEKYIAAKRLEWKRYNMEITDWEIREYLYKH